MRMSLRLGLTTRPTLRTEREVSNVFEHFARFYVHFIVVRCSSVLIVVAGHSSNVRRWQIRRCTVDFISWRFRSQRGNFIRGISGKGFYRGRSGRCCCVWAFVYLPS